MKSRNSLVPARNAVPDGLKTAKAAKGLKGFQRVWEGWAAGFMAFRAFHNLSFQDSLNCWSPIHDGFIVMDGAQPARSAIRYSSPLHSAACYARNTEEPASETVPVPAKRCLPADPCGYRRPNEAARLPSTQPAVESG